MSVATDHDLDLPLGRTADGLPAWVPLRETGWGRSLLVTGGVGTGKSVVLANLAVRAAHAGAAVALYATRGETWVNRVSGTRFAQGVDLLDHLGQVKPGPRVVIVDAAESAFAASPALWAEMALTASAAGHSLIVATYGLRLEAFGDRPALRSALQGGSVLRLPTKDTWDRHHEAAADLASLQPHTAYLQRHGGEVPVLVHLDPPGY